MPKKIWLTALALLGLPYVSATADMTGLSTSVSIDDDGLAVIRLWAQFDQAGDAVIAVWGDASNGLSIWTDDPSGFHQDACGGDASTSINPALYDSCPGLQSDSWMTIGCMDQLGTLPNGSVVSNNLLTSGMEWSSPTELSTTDGAWFITPDDAQGLAVDGQCLLGQFSVRSDLGFVVSGSINVLVRHADASWAEHVALTFEAMAEDPALWGACCVGGVCELLSADACAAQGGAFRCAGTSCDDAPCNDLPWADSVWTPDLNGDGTQDLVRRTSDCVVGLHLVQDGVLGVEVVLPAPGHAWRLIGVADADGDGDDDLYWQSDGGPLEVHLLDALEPAGVFVLWGSTTYWTADGVSDFDFDGGPDVVWRSPGGNLKVFRYDTQGTYLGSVTLDPVGSRLVLAVKQLEFGSTAVALHDTGTGEYSVRFYDQFNLLQTVTFADPAMGAFSGLGVFDDAGQPRPLVTFADVGSQGAEALLVHSGDGDVLSLPFNLPGASWIAARSGAFNGGQLELGFLGTDADVLHVVSLEQDEPCIGDIDGNGAVTVDDLLTLLSAYGSTDGGPADLDGDGIVGVDDLLLLISAFGPC